MDGLRLNDEALSGYTGFYRDNGKENETSMMGFK